MSTSSSDKNLAQEIGHAVVARGFTAATVATLVLLAVLAFTAYSPRWYRSEAKLFVRVGRESVGLDPTATTGQVLPVQGTRENEIFSVYHLLRSRELAAEIVDRLGVSAFLHTESTSQPEAHLPDLELWDRVNPLYVYNERDLAIHKFSKLLDVVVEKNSSVISISYDAKEPMLARDVVQLLIERAREVHLKIHTAEGSESFFSQQATVLRDRVARLEEQLRDLRNESSVADLQLQRELQVQRIGKLEEDGLRYQAEIDAAAAQIDALQAAQANMPETIQTAETIGLPNTAAAGMQQQLFSLQIQEKELTSKNTEDNVLVQQIRDQIDLAKAELAAHRTPPQLTRGINQARLDLQEIAIRRSAELAAVKSQLAAVETQVAQERVALARLNDYGLKVSAMERELELEVAGYRRYVEKLEQARIDTAIQLEGISNLNLLQAPTLSVTPVFPHVPLTLVLGVLLSLFAGIASAVALQLLRPAAEERSAVPVPARVAPLPLTPGVAHA